ncbi:hypothetical protein ElyMa_006344400 [Elysia marginata]|uniref:Uncharacterized protein n=1 Tax=Elysia marginata TaxID=1093978 RepID=A0AAV4HJ38_9GAST|nr:hypothetical protein ElyMa_006344400 [Elysia marginata]
MTTDQTVANAVTDYCMGRPSTVGLNVRVPVRFTPSLTALCCWKSSLRTRRCAIICRFTRVGDHPRATVATRRLSLCCASDNCDGRNIPDRISDNYHV